MERLEKLPPPLDIIDKATQDFIKQVRELFTVAATAFPEANLEEALKDVEKGVQNIMDAHECFAQAGYTLLYGDVDTPFTKAMKADKEEPPAPAQVKRSAPSVPRTTLTDKD